jgi:uncharacterized membrane protein YqgA involved in biofilm formation
MVLTGTLVNAAAIVAGGLIGSNIKGIRDEMGKTVLQGLSLAVLLLGIMMSMKSNQFLIVISSLVLGGILGEWWSIEQKLNQLGQWIEKKTSAGGEGKIAVAFVTTTLVYCVGSMAILGSLDSGLRNDHQILYTKAMLDGFSAVIFASTLGIGVVYSAIPVLIYQGLIAISSTFISTYIEPVLLEKIIQEITATGGILIMAIGLNILEIVKIRVANLLPAILVAGFIVPLVEWIASIIS